MMFMAVCTAGGRFFASLTFLPSFALSGG